MDNRIVSDVEGVVAKVEITTGGSVGKGANMISVYPKEAIRLEVAVSEMDLTEIAEGDTVFIEFDYDADGLASCEGVVESISHVSKAESGSAEYSAYIVFEPDENVRLGMSAVAYTVDMQELDEE